MAEVFWKFPNQVCETEKNPDSSSLAAHLDLGEECSIISFYFAQAIVHLLYWETIKGELYRGFFFISLLQMARPALLDHCHINDTHVLY